MKRPPHIRDKEPRGGKNFMVAFESDTEDETWVYNHAVYAIMKRHDLSPFHQIGGTEPRRAGYHGWEIWCQRTRAQMEALLPEIETEAEVARRAWGDDHE